MLEVRENVVGTDKDRYDHLSFSGDRQPSVCLKVMPKGNIFKEFVIKDISGTDNREVEFYK